MTDAPTHRALVAARVVALLMVISLQACDNVEWGGIDVAIVPPPPTGSAAEAELEAADRMPQGPVLYHVVRDSAVATITPVAEVADDGLLPIDVGDDPAVFGGRFISAFFRAGAEMTVFRNGRRAGTLIVDSASVPAGTCRSLPRGIGHLELSGGVGVTDEFLAMARTQAPEGRMPSDSMAPQRRMLTLGDMLAEQALRRRGAQLPSWPAARVQVQPFPVADASDLGFTATYLVDDALAVGNDSLGYSLFLVAVPAETGYDSVYVEYRFYPQTGKAAPRVIDFLDWDRDGQAELLLQVYGTDDAWYEAIGSVDGEWRRTLQDRCDAMPAAVAADSLAADSVAPEEGAGAAAPAGQIPAARAPTPLSGNPTIDSARARLDSLLAQDPEVRLSVPRTQRPRRDTTPPDTSGA